MRFIRKHPYAVAGFIIGGVCRTLSIYYWLVSLPSSQVAEKGDATTAMLAQMLIDGGIGALGGEGFQLIKEIHGRLFSSPTDATPLLPTTSVAAHSDGFSTTYNS